MVQKAILSYSKRKGKPLRAFEQERHKIIFYQMVLEQSDIHMPKIMKSNLNFTPYKNINSKWITDTNVKHRTIKLSGEKKNI